MVLAGENLRRATLLGPILLVRRWFHDKRPRTHVRPVLDLCDSSFARPVHVLQEPPQSQFKVCAAYVQIEVLQRIKVLRRDYIGGRVCG